MISKNVPDEPDQQDEKPELGPGDMKTLMHILLIAVNGITVPQKTFDEYPKDKIEFTRVWDPVKRSWNFFVPIKCKIKRKKRKIFTRKRNIIIPN